MKVGDLVRLKKICETQADTRAGIAVDVLGRRAVVMYDDCRLNIPVVDLEVIRESR